MAGERWLFSQEQLANTPSRKTGIDNDKEIYYRQQAANFVQDMGQRLQVTQLCINTAIVYLHRFYMFHSFSKFHRNAMAEACLFLAAKVEEQPRKLEHIIKTAHMILHREQGSLDTKSVAYLEHAQELVINENILLQTLGFELQVDHPHTHIVKTCQLIRALDAALPIRIVIGRFAVVAMVTAAKDLAQTSYFLATNSLHLTQMCLLNKPTFVACVCIHLACKWAQFEIPQSNEGKEWFSYVDKTMTAEILEDLTQNFLAILDKCPSKFKKKLMSKSAKDEDLMAMMAQVAPPERKHRGEMSTASSSDESKPVVNNHEVKDKVKPNIMSPQVKHEKRDSPAVTIKSETQPKPSTSTSVPDGSMRRVKTESYLTALTTKEYFEKRERERLERERIDKERQLLIEKDKREKAEAARAAKRRAEKEKLLAERSSSNLVRQHTNIFEEMASAPVKTEPTPSVADPSAASQPKENHSAQRLHGKHNYKDKYHEKDPGARKLPFSVDVSKLPKENPEDQKKPSGYRYPDRKSEPSRETSASNRHGHDPKHKSHAPHSDHRGSEHRPRWPRPGPEEVRTKPSLAEPPTMGHKPAAEVGPPVPNTPVDPEEGEIIDDDSPPVEEPKETKKVHSTSSSSHAYHHHHRERKSSGHRHHSPGANVPPSSHQEPPSVNPDKRRRSPRNGRPSKDEPSLSSSEHPEQKSSSVHPEPGLSEAVAPNQPTGPECASTRAPPEATPEPGEIVELSRKHHHKSSRRKSHKKEKHRDRDHTSLSDNTGSLKIKLDLKGVGKLPTPIKHDSPASTTQHVEERDKKVKLKIKPLAMMHDIPDLPVSSRDTPTSSKGRDPAVSASLSKEPHIKLIQSDHRPKDSSSSSKSRDPASSHREGTPNLKIKLKVPSSSSTVAGNGHTPTTKLEVRGSVTDNVQSPGSNRIKLVLSKDSLGQYTPTPTGGSSSSHKHHKHSTAAIDRSSSRKRPFSPSESSTPRHKLPRNDSSSNMSRSQTNNAPGDRSGTSSVTGSPFRVGDTVKGKPSEADIHQSLGLIQQLIDKTQEQILQRRPDNATPTWDAANDLQ